jgi:hypothetical protein
VLLSQSLDRQRCFVSIAQAFRRRTRTAPTRHARTGRLRPDHRLTGDADRIGQAALLQPGAELAAVAVVGIGQHHTVRQAPNAYLVEQLQSQFPFLVEDRLRGDADALASCPVLRPAFGQVQTPSQGLAAGGTGLMQAHRDLAIRPSAQRATVLALYPDRVVTFVGELVSSRTQKASPSGEQAIAASFSQTGSQSQGLWLTNCWSACSSPSGRRGTIAPTLFRSHPAAGPAHRPGPSGDAPDAPAGLRSPPSRIPSGCERPINCCGVIFLGCGRQTADHKPNEVVLPSVKNVAQKWNPSPNWRTALNDFMLLCGERLEAVPQRTVQ